MKSVRIEPVAWTKLLIGVTCDCGCSFLTNKATGETSFNHLVSVKAVKIPEITLQCDYCGCDRKYLIRLQNGHAHVSDI